MLKGFLKYYGLVVLCTFSLIFTTDYVFQRYQQQQAQQQIPLLHIFELIEDYCRQQECSAQTPLPFSQAELLGSAEIHMPPTSLAALHQGEILGVTQGKQEYYYRQLSPKLLLRYGPVEQSPTTTWYTTAFYLLLATMILLGLYPLFRDMYQLRDASTRFAQNRQLEQLQLPASRYFAPVNDAFYWMIKKIARLLALQKELSDTLSHELRTGITRLNFNLAVLTQDNVEESRAALQQDIDELNLLVEEYLGFAQQEHLTPKLNLTKQSLTPIIEHYITQLGQYSSRKISLVNECTLDVMVDKRMIARAIKNLIDNAIKYSATEVKVSHLTTAQGVVIQVEDDGKGLGTTHIDELFLPYTRSSNTKHIAGYGLGLAITRKIVDWHGGELSAEASANLGGACFRLTLPNIMLTSHPK